MITGSACLFLILGLAVNFLRTHDVQAALAKRRDNRGDGLADPAGTCSFM